MDQPHLQIFNVHDDEELFGHSIHDYKLKPGLRQWPLQIGMLMFTLDQDQMTPLWRESTQRLT